MHVPVEIVQQLLERKRLALARRDFLAARDGSQLFSWSLGTGCRLISPIEELRLELFLRVICKREDIAQLVKELRFMSHDHSYARQRANGVRAWLPLPRLPGRATQRDRALQNRARLLGDIVKHCKRGLVLHLDTQWLDSLRGLELSLGSLTSRIVELRLFQCRYDEIGRILNAGRWPALRSLVFGKATVWDIAARPSESCSDHLPALSQLEIYGPVPTEQFIHIQWNSILPDFSSAIALKHLRVLGGVCMPIRLYPHFTPPASIFSSNGGTSIPFLPRAETLVPSTFCSPAVETFEWMVADNPIGHWPWLTVRHVHATLVAFDRGGMPCLQRIAVRIVANRSTDFRIWAIVSFVLRGFAASRGLSFRLDVEIRQEEDDVDLFARQERARVDKSSSKHTLPTPLFFIWRSLYCIGYLGCCCFCASLILPDEEEI
ncbi:hypothetical protein BKA62DRAFT_672704 [Auriculariales sp. MPI-PUGE-AT-0066]|nr:hypothetical protein BKA62DRAFT_672704 [Auriculariales sp. MPI-PUGE-AT-0066]